MSLLVQRATRAKSHRAAKPYDRSGTTLFGQGTTAQTPGLQNDHLRQLLVAGITKYLTKHVANTGALFRPDGSENPMPETIAGRQQKSVGIVGTDPITGQPLVIASMRHGIKLSTSLFGNFTHPASPTARLEGPPPSAAPACPSSGNRRRMHMASAAILASTPLGKRGPTSDSDADDERDDIPCPKRQRRRTASLSSRVNNNSSNVDREQQSTTHEKESDFILAYVPAFEEGEHLLPQDALSAQALSSALLAQVQLETERDKTHAAESWNILDSSSEWLPDIPAPFVALPTPSVSRHLGGIPDYTWTQLNAREYGHCHVVSEERRLRPRSQRPHPYRPSQASSSLGRARTHGADGATNGSERAWSLSRSCALGKRSPAKAQAQPTTAAPVMPSIPLAAALAHALGSAEALTRTYAMSRHRRVRSGRDRAQQHPYLRQAGNAFPTTALDDASPSVGWEGGAAERVAGRPGLRRRLPAKRLRQTSESHSAPSPAPAAPIVPTFRTSADDTPCDAAVTAIGIDALITDLGRKFYISGPHNMLDAVVQGIERLSFE